MAFDYVKFDMISSGISILTMLAQKSLKLKKINKFQISIINSAVGDSLKMLVTV